MYYQSKAYRALLVIKSWEAVQQSEFWDRQAQGFWLNESFTAARAAGEIAKDCRRRSQALIKRSRRLFVGRRTWESSLGS